jgi:hypothetical protein
MTVYWVATDSDDALEALAAVDHALATDTRGTPPAPPAAGATHVEVDSYLDENLAAAEATWAVDPHQIVVSNRPGLAAALNAFQRLFRRATWWYTLPQWLQINEHHAAVVRALSALANHDRQSRGRITALERELTRLHAVERQAQVLRFEQAELRRRISSLEEQLARTAEATGER